MRYYHDGFIDGLNDVKEQMQKLIDIAPSQEMKYVLLSTFGVLIPQIDAKIENAKLLITQHTGIEQ